MGLGQNGACRRFWVRVLHVSFSPFVSGHPGAMRCEGDPIGLFWNKASISQVDAVHIKGAYERAV